MSADDDVSSLSGIGPKRAETLQKQGIYTLRDLIEKESILSSDLKKYAREARKVCRDTGHRPHTITNSHSLHPTNTEGLMNINTISSNGEHKNEHKPDLEAYCLERHSWFEQNVRIPVLSKGMCVEAQVHELAMIPGANQWIGFVCALTSTSSTSTGSATSVTSASVKAVCSVTPATLLHYNPHLPALILHVKEDEHNVLMQQVPSLKAVMYELNCMRNVPVT